MADTQTILFGADNTEGITAIETGESEVILYIRRDGQIESVREPFIPWMLVARKDDIPSGAQFRELEGDGFRYMITFPTWADFMSARSSVRSSGGDSVGYGNPEKQYLMTSGKTLFKGMTFEDVHRMQIDIETTSLTFDQESEQIFMIAVSDNRGFEDIVEGSEPEMIERLVNLVRERDPEVIEGHNFFGFDLPFISARAKRHGIKLALGRDGSELTFQKDRTVPVGGYSKPFTPARIHGRHIIDTLLAVQRYDITGGRLERYGLKDCALTLGLAEPDRVYIPGDQILSLWESEPDKVRLYARHDVRETRALAALVCPAEFYLTQMTPDTYQSVATTGQGEKINSILIREYLRQDRAIPQQQQGRQVPGGYTEIRETGLIRHVVKCDVESLYPSLMLVKRIKPAADTLDIFLPALAELTKRRFEAKRNAKAGIEREKGGEGEREEGKTESPSSNVQHSASNGQLPMFDLDHQPSTIDHKPSTIDHLSAEASAKADRPSTIDHSPEYWNGLQSSFKIMINSFYGYLGAPFNFNDFDAAAEITTSGQAIGKQIAESIEHAGGRVIEIDTDGVYFRAPQEIETEDDERTLIERISSELPEGINLAHDGRYAAMLSLKIKNYVLIGYDGRKVFKGASVRSRADEAFGREFISQVVDLLASGDAEGAGKLYQELIETIREGLLPVEQFARRERVTGKTFKSSQKKRSAVVAKGSAVGDYITVYEKNNGELGLVEDYQGDEDRDYLMDKLYKFANRLREGFGDDFDRLFPKPGFRAPTAKAAEAAGQKTFDLF